MGMVMCNSRPFSTGRFNVKPAPKGVTSMSRVISVHSTSTVSRHLTRTGSLSSKRSRMRFQFRGSDICNRRLEALDFRCPCMQPARRFWPASDKRLHYAEAIDFTRVLQAFAVAKNRPPGYNKTYFFDLLSCLSRHRSSGPNPARKAHFKTTQKSAAGWVKSGHKHAGAKS